MNGKEVGFGRRNWDLGPTYQGFRIFFQLFEFGEMVNSDDGDF